jgi:hypothetical protein
MMMRTTLGILMLLAVTGPAMGAGDDALESFARRMAVAVFSNDFASVARTALPPNAGWIAETSNSWNRTRATAEARGVDWTNCVVTDLRIQKLETHGSTRAADVLVNCTDGTLVFTLFLDECQERKGKWYLCVLRWREPKGTGGTTTPPTVQ